MSRNVRRYFLISAFLLCALSAVADDQCASKSDDWTCFSSIEIQPDAAGQTFRMVIFPKQELLAEIENGGVVKQYLALPSGIQLYSGLSADESIPFTQPAYGKGRLRTHCPEITHLSAGWVRERYRSRLSKKPGQPGYLISFARRFAP
jgi:hypothetical protein